LQGIVCIVRVISKNQVFAQTHCGLEAISREGSQQMFKVVALLTVIPLCFAAQVVSAKDADFSLTINQWVQPGPDRVLTGRIVVPSEIGSTVAVQGAEVVMVRCSNGESLQAEAKTNANGEFLIQGVQPGIYSLTAHADQVLAVCAVHALDSDLVAERDFPSTIHVVASDIDFDTLQTAVLRYMPTASQCVDVVSINTVNLDVIAPRTHRQDALYIQQSRGGVTGQLFKAGMLGEGLAKVNLTNVFILKDGIEIARALTNDAGEFSIPSIAAGRYSLMAIGQDGLAVVGFELIDETTNTTGDVIYAEFSLQVAPVNNFADMESQAVIDEQPSGTGAVLIADGGVINAGSGGFSNGGGGGPIGGGGGFSGGGFSGGGMLGGIAAIAAAGGAIAVAAGADGGSDSEIVSAPVASPVAPN
jgi:uncharacterized membrane protein YgcG